MQAYDVRVVYWVDGGADDEAIVNVVAESAARAHEMATLEIEALGFEVSATEVLTEYYRCQKCQQLWSDTETVVDEDDGRVQCPDCGGACISADTD